MENTPAAAIESIVSGQRRLFATNRTKDTHYRTENLRKLKSALVRYEHKIENALWDDLHKSPQETYLTEISIVKLEIDHHLKHLKNWARLKRTKTPFHLRPSRSRILYEPLGVALIMAPWNYPFQLLINPLVGAISSGCCAVLKPSPYTPETAKVMEEMIREIFDPEYVAIVQGDRDVNTHLLEQQFDIIFFTGSPDLGRTIMKAASKYLTPVVLELGGKSPCIVDADANIEVAARRIAWGKFMNAGQTCTAPDYLFVHQSVKEQLIIKIIEATEKMFGKDPEQSRNFGRIVRKVAVERIQKLMQHGTVRYGGFIDADQKYIAPTLIDDIQPDFPVMQEEIFGPVLPVMSFNDISEPIRYVAAKDKPLAFYFFGKNKDVREILSKSTAGGTCINDTLIHIGNHHLPFGGVGNSGMNRYHGHSSFLAFTNARSIMISPTWIDLAFRYPPFKFYKQVRKII